MRFIQRQQKLCLNFLVPAAQGMTERICVLLSCLIDIRFFSRVIGYVVKVMVTVFQRSD